MSRPIIKFYFLVLSVMLLTGACSQNKEASVNHETDPKELSMNVEPKTDLSSQQMPPIDAAAPVVFETASFGLGWFWGPDSQFGIIEGVIRTRVGYAGGKTIDPDYGNIGDHTETIQIDFDPRQITYNDLLKIFWASHKPTQRMWSRQYRHAVFYHNEAQRQSALQSKLSTEEKIGRKVRTEVLPLNAFYRAEDYHQKYILNRRSEFARELARIYPRKKDFVDSTAVARLNGYVGGHGDIAQLKLEIEALGLSADSRESLVDLVQRKGKGFFN